LESHRVTPAPYGALFHEVADQFSRAHGAAFGSRERTLEHWLQIADTLASEAFDTFLLDYPLVGEGVVDTERRRLRRDVRTLVEDDWDGGRPRTFVAAERSFGEGAPVALPTSAGALFVAGRIDRIDIERGLTLVRDFKTGRARPRQGDEVDPGVNLDLQLAVYMAVAERLAPEWSLPSDVAAAYVYVDHRSSERERAFRADALALRAAGRRWFDLAMGLIGDRSYIQTPDAGDCRICPFSSVCGDNAHATAERLQDATGNLAIFRDLKS
jgi:ATP-dependent helicase/DNAse subunit B